MLKVGLDVSFFIVAVSSVRFPSIYMTERSVKRRVAYTDDGDEY